MKAPLLCLVLALSASAQPDRDLGRSPVHTRRLALVIGNDAYVPPANPLHNAVNDARAMKSALEGVGFTVQMGLNVSLRQMDAVIGEFTGAVRPGDIALFFYSGHGLQVNDQNYLIPVDFQAQTAVDAKYAAYPAQRVQENLEAAGAGMQILVLDACRNNPFRSWRGGSDGLAAMQAGRGTYIAFATSPGKTADDNPRGRNGLFTGELIRILGQPGLSIDQVFNRVREQVTSRSNGLQLPWSTSSVTGEFYFRATTDVPVSTPPHQLSSPAQRDLGPEQELAFWNAVKDENDSALLEEYLGRYPSGIFVNIARSKLNRLKALTPAPTKPASPTLANPTNPSPSSTAQTFAVQPTYGSIASLIISTNGVKLENANPPFEFACVDVTAVSFSPIFTDAAAAPTKSAKKPSSPITITSPLYFIFRNQYVIKLGSSDRARILQAVASACALGLAADGESAVRNSSPPESQPSNRKMKKGMNK